MFTADFKSARTDTVLKKTMFAYSELIISIIFLPRM